MDGGRTLGRLLVVGLTAGASIGALVGAVLAAPTAMGQEGAVILAGFGAAAGLLASIPTQIVTFGLLRVGHRRVHDRLLVATVPGIVAGLSTSAAGAAFSTRTYAIVATMAAVTLAILIAVVTLRWCQRPPRAS